MDYLFSDVVDRTEAFYWKLEVGYDGEGRIPASLALGTPELRLWTNTTEQKLNPLDASLPLLTNFTYDSDLQVGNRVLLEIRSGL